MTKDGSAHLNSASENDKALPLWLLCELTYKCQLQCPYCSNPVDYANHKNELSTAQWIDIFQQARKLGATQLGFSGGEPLLRRDLRELITEGHRLGYYTNLITSTLGMDEKRLQGFKEAGLDHIQVSFQAGKQEINDYLAGTNAFRHKLTTAALVKQYDFSLVFNIVLTKFNIDDVKNILDMAIALGSDYIELANAQYYGWALQNRDKLMPTRAQVEAAEVIAHDYQARYKGKVKIYFVVSDYYENRPKPCMNGWGKVFLTVTADGFALPCHAARVIKEIEYPNIQDHDLKWIWEESPAFNHFRGYAWMKPPCRTCPERENDFGGCRCQAYLLTGDAANADPVCDLSVHHKVILSAVDKAALPENTSQPLLFRNPKNSKKLSSLLSDQPRYDTE